MIHDIEDGGYEVVSLSLMGEKVLMYAIDADVSNEIRR